MKLDYQNQCTPKNKGTALFTTKETKLLEQTPHIT